MQTAIAFKPVVARTAATRAVRPAATRVVVCRAQQQNKKAEAVAAGVSAAVIGYLANPLVAEAAVTPSLKNLLNSVVAGGLVLAVIAGAVTAVSNFDSIERK